MLASYLAINNAKLSDIFSFVNQYLAFAVNKIEIC